MRCPRCNKINPVGRPQCIYCSARLEGNYGTQRKRAVTPVNWVLILTLTVSIIIVVVLLLINPFKSILNPPSGGSSANPTADSGGGDAGGGSAGGTGGGTGGGSAGGSADDAGGGSQNEPPADPSAPADENNDDGPAAERSAQIPDDAVEIDGNYYLVYTDMGLSSMDACESFCEGLGGHLAVITSDKLNDSLYDLVRAAGVKTAIIGYSDSKIEGNWEWVTDAQPSYTNWGKTEPNGAADEEDCCIFSTTEANGKWNDSEFGYETRDFICQWNDYGVEDEPIAADIPSDAVEFNGHYYYIFDNGKDNWSEAQSYCKSRGGDLVVINNEEENAFLYQYMKDQGHVQAFIGYSDEESEGIWYWVSGKSSNYTDWGVNDDGETEPNSDSRWENFAQLDVDMIAGTWNDSSFGQNGRAYICEWE